MSRVVRLLAVGGAAIAGLRLVLNGTVVMANMVMVVVRIRGLGTIMIMVGIMAIVMVVGRRADHGVADMNVVRPVAEEVQQGRDVQPQGQAESGREGDAPAGWEGETHSHLPYALAGTPGCGRDQGPETSALSRS